MITSQSGLWGGGFVNVIAESASAGARMIVGGDVSGFHVTTDGGQHWSTSNRGMTDYGQAGIASVAYDRANPNIVYAAYGHHGGGFEKSTDGGVNWPEANRRTTVRFNAGASGTGGPFGTNPTHARSTGNLFVQDPANGLLYVGTFKDGVYRSADGGSTWQQIALGPNTSCIHPRAYVDCYTRTMQQDPNNPTTLIVGTYGDGAFRITEANSPSPTVTRIATAPVEVEEVLFEGDVLYCACGKAGVYEATSPYATWTNVSANLPLGGTTSWAAIAVENGAVYVGAVDAPLDPTTGLSHSIMKLPRGQTSWQDVTLDATKIHITVGGPSGPDWWLGLSSGAQSHLIGHQYYDASSMVVSDGLLWVAGRSGVWVMDTGTQDWYPYVKGLGITVNKAVAISEKDPGRLLIGNVDWTFFFSMEHGGTVTRSDPPGPPSSTAGYSLTVDPQDPKPSDAYLGVGNPRDKATGGDIFLSADPASHHWVSSGRTLATTSRPIGIAAGRDASGNTVVIAAVDGQGLWRHVGGKESPWTPVARPGVVLGDQGASDHVPVIWPNGTGPYVYVLDVAQGALFRSSDYGASWTKILTVPGPPLDTTTGYLAADTTRTGRLWLTTNTSDGTWLITGANAGTVTCPSAECRQFTTPVNPGPVAVKAGTSVVYLAGRAASGADAGLWKSVDLGSSWSNLATSIYAGSAMFPESLAVSADGYAYVATRGMGVIVTSGV